MPNSSNASFSGKNVALIILVLGSAWGFLEVVLGGAMKASSIPYKGDLLTGLGIGLMAVAAALLARPLAGIGIAALAVAVKQLAVPLLGLSFFCKANSCLAVMLAGGALAAATAVAGRRLAKGILPRVAVGCAAGLSGAGAFYWLGMRLAPCPYLLSFNHAGGFASFMVAEGLIWAALGGAFFPAGYRLGLALRGRLADLEVRKPALYYATALTAAAMAWLASGIAIAFGL
jgi:hypothetical protein